jgi:hypothetical protein
MNNEQLYIPTRCKVGLQLNSETFTGKLGYVIYHDGKIWRKQDSWESWRHKEEYSQWRNEKGTKTEVIIKRDGVKPIEFDNIPTAGFILNKKAGGGRSGWNKRQTYCRVFDPRGWEFEISIPNLLFILDECGVGKGKALEGEYVYSWDGKDLVLLPLLSKEYKICNKFTELQHKKISSRDLVVGREYLTSKEEKLTYLGFHNICADSYHNKTEIEYELEEKENEYYNRKWSNKRITKRASLTKKHVFVYTKRNYNGYEFLSSMDRIKLEISESINPDIESLIEKLQKSEYYSLADHLEIQSPLKNYGNDRTFMYKYCELKTLSDLVSSKRYVEGGKAYIYDNDNYRRSVVEGDYSPEKYGRLVRYYKNGFFKNL